MNFINLSITKAENEVYMTFFLKKSYPEKKMFYTYIDIGGERLSDRYTINHKIE